MSIFFAIPGLLRTIGATLVVAAPIISELPIPEVASWSGTLLQLGTWLSGLGLARAGLRNFGETFKR